MTTKTIKASAPEANGGAEEALNSYDRLAAALHPTSVETPECLAEESQISRDLGVREVAGGDAAQLRSKLDAVRARQETCCTQARRRQRWRDEARRRSTRACQDADAA